MHQANVMHTMALRPESMEGTGSEASWLQMACYAAPGWAKSEAGGGILAGKNDEQCPTGQWDPTNLHVY